MLGAATVTMVGRSDWISEGGGSLLQHLQRQVSEQRIHATMMILRKAMYPIVLLDRAMRMKSISTNSLFSTKMSSLYMNPNYVLSKAERKC